MAQNTSNKELLKFFLHSDLHDVKLAVNPIDRQLNVFNHNVLSRGVMVTIRMIIIMEEGERLSFNFLIAVTQSCLLLGRFFGKSLIHLSTRFRYGKTSQDIGQPCRLIPARLWTACNPGAQVSYPGPSFK